MAERKWYCKSCGGLLERPAETAAGNQAQGYCSTCSNMMWGLPAAVAAPEPAPDTGEHAALFQRCGVGMQITLSDAVALAAAVVLGKGQRVAVLSSDGLVGILVPAEEAQ